ncbi:MAG: PLP-dependent aminotransferase family protein [Anaerovoracaceae bacterium]|jgi:GntR family transcriptional regulator/MocR family aminotransferase
MRPITPEFDHNSKKPLYEQLYEYLKREILDGGIAAGEKLPSLRSIARQLEISVTTAESAYNQLLVEGYIQSRPQSGYYAASLTGMPGADSRETVFRDYGDSSFESPPYKCDLASFDFGKWKKCTAKVLNDYPNLLLYEGDPQGEKVLRAEIARYVYHSRGAVCTPDQIVISAGTQQLINHLSRILRRIGIGHVSTETPGYLPVQNSFRDQGFSISRIPVARDGLMIEKLPINIPSAVYVSPSNQFPTGTVMPIARRYKLLEWATENDSIILEDDYDSELRYFGRPLPSLKSLDREDRVVYLGSFTSTLFKAIRISYMILPAPMADIFNEIKSDYTQTCSKTEQLTLALFMEKGYYQTNIRKLRKLYSQKLSATLAAIREYGSDFVSPLNTRSGINLILNVRSQKPAEELVEEARSLQLEITGSYDLSDIHNKALIFYYNQIPLEEIPETVRQMIELWRS